MKPLLEIKHWLEYLGGATDQRPRGFPRRGGWLLVALWWALLVCLIAAFCGQSSKFIYIDF